MGDCSKQDVFFSPTPIVFLKTHLPLTCHDAHFGCRVQSFKQGKAVHGVLRLREFIILNHGSFVKRKCTSSPNQEKIDLSMGAIQSHTFISQNWFSL